MIILFYISGIMAILSTLFVICSKNPIHALCYLIVSLFFVSCNLFSLGASFAAALEIIIYAGAIMVLFVFTIMLFDMKDIYLHFDDGYSSFLSFRMCFGILLLMSSLLIVLLYNIFEIKDYFINISTSSISLKKIGVKLFDSYVLVVEMASFLLLSSLISVIHMIQSHEIFTNSDFK